MSWKKIRNQPICAACVDVGYVPVSLKLSVAVPLDQKIHGESWKPLSWEELWDVLGATWERVTDAKNWKMNKLQRNDVVMTPEARLEWLAESKRKDGTTKLVVKLPKGDPKESYDYLALSETFDLPSQSAAILDRELNRMWQDSRWSVIVANNVKVCRFKKDQALPLNPQSYDITWQERPKIGGMSPVISFLLPDRRVRVALRASPKQFGRHLEKLAKVVPQDPLAPSDGKLGNAYVRRVEDTPSSHRKVHQDRDSKTGQKRHWRIAVTICVLLPKEIDKSLDPTKTLMITSASDHLFVLSESETRIHPYGEDHVVRKVREMERKLGDKARMLDELTALYLDRSRRREVRKQRLSDDNRYENRLGRRYGLSIRSHLECAKFARFQLNHCHTVSASHVEWARRLGCGRIVLDLNHDRFLSCYPYSDYVNFLKYKCSRVGIDLHIVETAETSVNGNGHLTAGKVQKAAALRKNRRIRKEHSTTQGRKTRTTHALEEDTEALAGALAEMDRIMR